MHPMVLGELACGNFRDRKKTLAQLHTYQRIPEASHEQVLDLIEAESLYGTGIGFIDAHLVCAALMDGDTQIWTRDNGLRRVAERLGIEHKDAQES